MLGNDDRTVTFPQIKPAKINLSLFVRFLERLSDCEGFRSLHNGCARRCRIVWFKRYPAKQTLIAFLLALLATTAFSIDPAPVSSNAVLAIDPKASGMLYVSYEVLLSFAGHTDAVMLLALACLLTLPFRYVFFGRGDAWRPSVILPSLFFAVCMVFGRSYDLTDSARSYSATRLASSAPG